MKQIHPKIENGMDSYNEAFQNTEKPVSKKKVPTVKSRSERPRDR